MTNQEEPRAKTPSRQETPNHPTPLGAFVPLHAPILQTHPGAFAPLRDPFRLLPWPQEDRTSVFAQYTLLVQDRDALQARLHQAGIPTAVHYPAPLNEQPAYAHHCCPDCTPVAQQM